MSRGRRVTSPLPGKVNSILGTLGSHLDLAILVGIVVGMNLVGKGVPLGIQGLGLVDGARFALQALGIVLVVRSNRIINFAQVQFGAVSGVIFYELVSHSQFIALAHSACPPCFPGIPTDSLYLQTHPGQFIASLLAHHYDILLQINFWLSLVVALALAPALAWLAYILIIGRLNKAPRLIATVATIGIGQVVLGISGQIGTLFQDRPDQLKNAFYLPVHDIVVTVSPALFHLGDVLTVVVTVVAAVGLAMFFRLSRTGIAIRGASENPQRAQTLGISVNRLSGTVWFAIGMLSAIAAILDVISRGRTSIVAVSLGDATTLTLILTAVVFARLTNLWFAAGACLLLEVIDHSMSWALGAREPFEGLLLLFIEGSLLLQRSRSTRAEADSGAEYLAAREARPIPRELRHVAVVEAYVRWFIVALVVVILGFPFVMAPSQVTIGTVLILNAIVGLSLLLLTGWAGQISLGQMAFAAVGAYVATYLRGRFNLDILLCLLAAATAGSVVAVIVGLPALRLKGLYLAVTTMAFALATTSLVLNARYVGQYLPTTIDRPFYLGFDLSDERVFFYFSLLFLVIAIVAIVGLRRSRTARALISCRDNDNAAQSFGINLFRVRLQAFAFSGFLAAFAGGLFAFHEHGVEPAIFGVTQSMNVFLMVVIGGMGSIAGPLLGSLYQSMFVLFSDPVLASLGIGGGVLVVLLLAPGGLGALAYEVRDGMLRRVALRYRIVVPSLLGDKRGNALDQQSPIAPKMGAGGTNLFVPAHYRLQGQWAKLKKDMDV